MEGGRGKFEWVRAGSSTINMLQSLHSFSKYTRAGKPALSKAVDFQLGGDPLTHKNQVLHSIQPDRVKTKLKLAGWSPSVISEVSDRTDHFAYTSAPGGLSGLQLSLSSLQYAHMLEGVFDTQSSIQRMVYWGQLNYYPSDPLLRSPSDRIFLLRGMSLAAVPPPRSKPASFVQVRYKTADGGDMIEFAQIAFFISSSVYASSRRAVAERDLLFVRLFYFMPMISKGEHMIDGHTGCPMYVAQTEFNSIMYPPVLPLSSIVCPEHFQHNCFTAGHLREGGPSCHRGQEREGSNRMVLCHDLSMPYYVRMPCRD